MTASEFAERPRRSGRSRSRPSGSANPKRDRARNCGSTVIELERPGTSTDCLNPISPWTPLWIPGTEPCVLPTNR